MKPGKNNRKYKFIFPLVTAAAVTAGSFSAVTAAEVQGQLVPPGSLLPAVHRRNPDSRPAGAGG